MDSAVVDTKFKGIKLVQTTDFFYPNIDDPYLMGKIACANVLSDLYAMGVVTCDNMLMLLGISENLKSEFKDVIVKLILQGFNDLAIEAGTIVTGGQTVKNPWMIIGGVGTSIVSETEMIMPVNAVVGDIILLTKPLGTQVAVNAFLYQYKPDNWKKIEHIVTLDEVRKSYDTASLSMIRLNRTAAMLMHKYGSHAATDITGFGILGHAQNLASNQRAPVTFEIHTLPLIQKMRAVNDIANFGLMKGLSAETSGGLLIVLPPENAEEFIKEIEKIDGWPAWVVGKVIEGNRTAHIIDNPIIIEIEHHSFTEN